MALRAFAPSGARGRSPAGPAGRPRAPPGAPGRAAPGAPAASRARPPAQLLTAGQLLGLPWGAAGAMAGRLKRLVHRTVSPVTHDLFV